MHKVYVVSGDGDMAAVVNANDNFIHLSGIDELLDLVNRNDAELANLSLEDGDFMPSSSGDPDPELNYIEISSLEIAVLQLI